MFAYNFPRSGDFFLDLKSRVRSEIKGHSDQVPDVYSDLLTRSVSTQFCMESAKTSYFIYQLSLIVINKSR